MGRHSGIFGKQELIPMKTARKTPPYLAKWILLRMSRYEDDFLCVGDLDEEFKEILQQAGHEKARFWYWLQVLRSIPAYLRISIIWRSVMFKNYLKTAFRHIKRHKGYSFINIAGLAIGMTCCILILLYIRYELSYDKFHENAHDIYRIAFEIPDRLDMNASSFGLLAPALMQDFPEVRSAARIRRLESTVFYKDRAFTEKDFFLADPEFFHVFTFPVISGDPEKALSDPFSVLITQETAEKYFGDEDPMGKTLHADNKYDYKVAGILENPPQNSHFKFDFLASFITMERIWEDYSLSWMNTNRILTYVKLKKNYNPDDLERKFPEFLKRYGREDVVFHLQPLTGIHLHGNIRNDLEANSDIRYIYIFSVIALLIVLIACFNYMNLSTARSVYRSKEVGVRKVVGAERKHIIRQFMSESIIFALAALFISIFLVKLLLPAFNSLVDRHLSFNFFGDSEIFLGLFILAAIVGFTSGSYPALFLSSFRPALILKGMRGHRGSSAFRNFLVVFQFAISIVLIIGTLVIYQQLHYIRNRNLGFHKEQIVVVDLKDENLKNVYKAMRNDMKQNPRILGASFSCDLPNEIDARNSFRWEGQTEENRWQLFNTASVDSEFIDLLGLELTEGRNFSEKFPSDKQACILNETAVKILGWENPIGKRFGWRAEGTVIGVVKDFHHLSLRSAVGPTVFLHVDKETDLNLNYLLIKINPGDIPGALAFIKRKFEEYSPHYPFSFSFLDDRVDKMYRTDNRLGQILNVFSFTAIFIACLGLFGLAAFTAERKTKEIGIRKVIGASVSNIFFLLSREFIKLMIIAFILACPLAYFSMNRWLEGFAYRTHIGVAVFLVSALSAFVTVLVTISYQSIKAATANPVDSLRYE
jgi:putative ABC transport system permease protein